MVLTSTFRPRRLLFSCKFRFRYQEQLEHRITDTLHVKQQSRVNEEGGESTFDAHSP